MRPGLVVVLYSCDGCGLVDAPVNVKARGEEDVVAWVKAIGYELSFSHSYRSPHCRAREMKHVKIPLGKDSERIGDAADWEGGAPAEPSDAPMRPRNDLGSASDEAQPKDGG